MIDDNVLSRLALRTIDRVDAAKSQQFGSPEIVGLVVYDAIKHQAVLRYITLSCFEELGRFSEVADILQ